MLFGKLRSVAISICFVGFFLRMLLYVFSISFLIIFLISFLILFWIRFDYFWDLFLILVWILFCFFVEFSFVEFLWLGGGNAVNRPSKS